MTNINRLRSSSVRMELLGPFLASWDWCALSFSRSPNHGWSKDDVQPPARRAPSSVGSGRRSALAGCKRSAARCVNDPSEEVRQISQHFKCPKSCGELLGQSFPPAAKFFPKLNAGRWPSRRSVASQWDNETTDKMAELAHSRDTSRVLTGLEPRLDWKSGAILSVRLAFAAF